MTDDVKARHDAVDAILRAREREKAAAERVQAHRHDGVTREQIADYITELREDVEMMAATLDAIPSLEDDAATYDELRYQAGNVESCAVVSAMSENVWVVVGASGSYSDGRTWVVRAFTVEAEAKRFRDELIRILSEAIKADPERFDSWDSGGWTHPLDPYFAWSQFDPPKYATAELPVGWPITPAP